ncbi:hypothetical protein [Leptolyngbya sp. FACHB-261]|uniref:PD-(D/E)XK nuclease domain-containing protein n=1 Tax=Leptolyngbya sp. FACHB-261 TaxID=2692806 RepID=UPI001688E925|nr:hypothetical protein [Leptolyngbya sp. FACHB-261]
MEAEEYPTLYWHCAVKPFGGETYVVTDDLCFEDLQQQIVQPWLQSRLFTVAGTVISSTNQSVEIRISHTSQPQKAFRKRAYFDPLNMSSIELASLSNYRLLPIVEGKDYTFELLFSRNTGSVTNADTMLVEKVCRRISHSARILANRQRKDKVPYQVQDEYDVQDLLHAVLRAHLKYSVQEDPLQKVVGTRAGRADISIEDLGILIELKYVRGPNDQKKISNAFSQDLVLYSRWVPLKTLLFVIYNSSDLRDPEALEELSRPYEVSGKRFDVRVILT